jgi:agmatine deiminase
MITDSQTNTLFLADTLPNRCPIFCSAFEKVLNENKINFRFIPGTKDIWAVDYMPIQTDTNQFVQFVYNPKYLQCIKYKKTISDTDSICGEMNIQPLKSPIVLDGGNVVRSSNAVIMTDRIFGENPNYTHKQLIKELEEYFQVNNIYIIPEQPNDFTGHSDGMVRFLDDDTLLINDYKREKEYFRQAFNTAIRDTGLNWIEVPYNPYSNGNFDQANGDYINYLQMDNIIFLPIFGQKEDDDVFKLFEKVFNRQQIVTIKSSEIANEGGILNCISWNIRIE